MKATEALAQTSPGRIVLHALCLLRRPSRWSWHWQGILRELVPAPIPVSVWQQTGFEVAVKISTGGSRAQHPYSPRVARPSVTFSRPSSMDARDRQGILPRPASLWQLEKFPLV